MFVLIGFIFFFDRNSKVQNLNYFGSQTMFIFLILYKILRSIYYKIFKREPEFSKFPKHRIDIVYTLILVIGIMVLPLIIDEYITQRLIK